MPEHISRSPFACLDSFTVKCRRIRIYRVRQRGSGTVLHLSRARALRSLRDIQRQKLKKEEAR